MFEKSLYDLIRGLRNHKGQEKEYIANSLKECRAEVRGSDMDIKTMALLKLIYLEMVGHDMSWASFHVLEVMSSAKYAQKRVGYLGAVQSFRADTEVLMLATNLLKKDLVSSQLNTVTLPLITLPHLITPSLAMSTLSDLLPRLSHSSPTIRKKTIVTIYRLALVYPETLRPAWPKIKDRLMDSSEDPSVTAAIVNVVCELGWRRPQDFLPLAPRLFELLVDSGNNWMAIKLIKLFATLTPLEPRLVKKLLPPLTSIIRTTPAMSLLYECINGIIQGGILGGTDDSQEEIAVLCVSKLRGMIMVEGDANLKYVALLAFNKIVLTHPHLVAQQEDVIMDCIDSADISIRLRALDLVTGMVNSDNLMSIVARLMRQLKPSSTQTSMLSNPVEPDLAYDSNEEDANNDLKPDTTTNPSISDEYRTDVITRVLDMCSQDNYGSLTDFDWYIDVLTQLFRNAPVSTSTLAETGAQSLTALQSVSDRIGDELRNVAVKVQAIRSSAVQAAESIILAANAGSVVGGKTSFLSIAWASGEYASSLESPEDTMTALLGMSRPSTTSTALAVYLQAIMKIFSYMADNDRYAWSRERKTMMCLLMARILHVLDPLCTHPDLEVQERAVEFTELLRLAAEASAAQEASVDGDEQEAPLLLTQAIPSLFAGQELRSVAPSAQHNVQCPPGLDLDMPINSRLNELLRSAESTAFAESDEDEFEVYYHKPQPSTNITSLSSTEPAANKITLSSDDDGQSYQQSSATEEAYLDADIIARRRAERAEKNKDDPFYIPPSSDSSTPIHNILKDDNGTELDIDSIPIMQLSLGRSATPKPTRPTTTKPRQRIQIAADETLGSSGSSTPAADQFEIEKRGKRSATSKAKSFLHMDTSNISSFSLRNDESAEEGARAYDYERQAREEEEMAKAMKEVERLRLEMQRANERIQVKEGVKLQGEVVVKKKKKPKKKEADIATLPSEEAVDEAIGEVDATVIPVKKKKKTKKAEADNVGGGIEASEVAGPDVGVVKKKKKKKVANVVDMP